MVISFQVNNPVPTTNIYVGGEFLIDLIRINAQSASGIAGSFGGDIFFFACGKIDGNTGAIRSDCGKFAFTSVRTAVVIYLISFTVTKPYGAN